MNRKITKLLQDRGENYILPFFWQHGEDEATLREYMGAINDCGIGAVCVESRPHPDFCGPKWWTDMDIIMDEARQRGMRVWVLDDAHFPTGYANGAVTKAADELCKQFLHFKEVEVCGPLPSAQLDVASLARYYPNPFAAPPMFSRSKLPPRTFADDSLLAVCAMNVKDRYILTETCIDLTAQVSEGHLVWDVPEGMWRIYILYLTRNAGSRHDYINVIDRRCRPGDHGCI